MKHYLTIVICTYNRAHILPEALESLEDVRHVF